MDKHAKPLTFEEKKNLVESGKVKLTVANRHFSGKDILARTEPYLNMDLVLDRTMISWPNKMTLSRPGPTTTAYDLVNHKPISGVNFASQDYMSLCYHPGSVAASVEALKGYGTHSGGSPLFFGKHPYYFAVIEAFEKAFARIYSEPSCAIFSAGWMAGYGVIAALSSKNDHIVLDDLCHNCMQQGARASLATIHKVEHMNVDAMCQKIADIRQKFPKAGILAVTEGLFSMDSDCPDLDRLQKFTKQHNAILVVDSAHDMFTVGTKGLGNPGEMIKDFENVVLVGSGSKALSNNFGWCVSNKKSMPVFLSLFAGSLTFSNALAPPIAASVLHNINLLMSADGDERRSRLRDNVTHIRRRLQEAGFRIYGDPSPIVIVLIGPELISRGIANLLYEEGVIVNSVEFPACAPGDSRLRLQLQCDHTKPQLDHFVDSLTKVMPKVEKYVSQDEFTTWLSKKMLEGVQKNQQKL